jgi:hypothetical protein
MVTAYKRVGGGGVGWVTAERHTPITGPGQFDVLVFLKR